jgi:hypothetical protein
LPRTRGFHASLECLRKADPFVYDVTMVREHNRATNLYTALRINLISLQLLLIYYERLTVVTMVHCLRR